MTIELTRLFDGPAAERELDDALAALVRADAHAELEALLGAYLAVAARPLPTLARSVSADDVRLTGWEKVARMLAITADNHDPITAIGIDLDVPAGDRDPVLLVNYYPDLPSKRAEDRFIFSAADRAAISAACERYPVPWQGQFQDIHPDLSVVGLNELYRAIRDAAPAPTWPQKPQSREDSLDRYVAEWWLLLRLHQAICRDLASTPLPRRVPVIVGEHGWSRWLHVAYMPELIDPTVGSATRPEVERAPRPEPEVSSEQRDPPPSEDAGKSRRWEPNVDMATYAERTARLVQEFSKGRFDPKDLDELARAGRIAGSVLRKWIGR